MDLRLDRPKIRSNHLPKVTAPLWRAGVPPVPTAQAPRSRKLLLSPPPNQALRFPIPKLPIQNSTSGARSSILTPPYPKDEH